MREFIINRNDAGQRLDKFVSKVTVGMPNSLIYKALRTKKIKVNRKRAEASYKLSEGDVVLMFISEDFFTETDPDSAFLTIKPDVNVVYEDENLLLVNKRAGMSCIPDDREDRDTLATHVKAYLYKKGEYNPEIEASFTPALCNRIDRNTCGIVICAKNAETLRDMNHKIKHRLIQKKYLCIVHGTPNPRSAVLEGWLIKDKSANKVKVYDIKPKFGNTKNIKTGYKVLSSKADYSVLEVELFTGRTHQIRAHMAHIGHPLLGDGKYTVNKDDKKLGFKYQALCSYSVTIDGKEYSINPDKIWFMKDFNSGRLD